MKRSIILLIILLAAIMTGGCNTDKTIDMQNEEQFDFMRLAANRFSCRSFSDEEVPEDVLIKVLEAGRLAPTAVNKQPQRIYVIKSPEALAKLAEAYPRTYSAPAVLLFAYDENSMWDSPRHHGAIDVSIVATQCMLEAEELGLGTVWCGALDNEAIEQALGLPENEHSVLLMPIGYKSDTCEPSKMHTDRKPLEETVVFL